MAGGGGARGRIAGIVHVIKTEIGHTIKARRHFTGEFHQTGVATITSGECAVWISDKRIKDIITREEIPTSAAAIYKKGIIPEKAAAWIIEDRKIPILKRVIPETEKRPGYKIPSLFYLKNILY